MTKTTYVIMIIVAFATGVAILPGKHWLLDDMGGDP
jgi:hypothetical protein